ncbi:PPP4R2 [Popillia japonica]|uniref:PPP4R2 n=1 Tax=Popillia japonica TaxID=7064 RepID=A0AAW1KLQ3_POPJA
MENPEEILHSLEEFSKLKPKDIPRELEDYLCFVAKTGDPVYQWSAVKGLFREKLINVITEFYESCPNVEIPPCANVEMFNYESMKNFILEKLDTFAAAPFTVQRICELLTTPRKEYTRIDKYMRALEKNILVVSTTEPANRRNTENGEGIVNGIETEHLTEANSSNDINVEEMDDSPSWPKVNQQEPNIYGHTENGTVLDVQPVVNQTSPESQENISSPESRLVSAEPSTSSTDSVITCTPTEKTFVSIEPLVIENQPEISQDDASITITAIPAPVQKRRDSIEPITSDDSAVNKTVCSNCTTTDDATKDTLQDKLDIKNDEDSKTEEFKDSQTTMELPNSTIDNIEESNAGGDKPSEPEKDLENSSDVIVNDVHTTQQEEKEEPAPNPVPQLEPEQAQEETCDNSGEIENAETCVESSDKQLDESATDEVAKETETELKTTETTASLDEDQSSSADSTDEATSMVKTASSEEDNILLDTEVDPIGILIEKQPPESPMDVDTDENLVESATEVSPSIETNTN